MNTMSKERYDWLQEVYGILVDTIKYAEENELWSLDVGPDAPQISRKEGNKVEFVRSVDQDCECVTHIGQHWKHEDDLWRASNMKMLDIVNDKSKPLWDRELALLGFVQEDEQRLREKLWNLQQQEGQDKID